jgi:poly-beta-1,6-N-acetyl-D-glucosamine synthase
MNAVLRYAVVTPARNEADNLPRLFESLRAQTHQPDVWIVVDNGSTDGTRQLLVELAEQENWIRPLLFEADAELARGGTVTRAFHAGLRDLDGRPDVVVKVDADVSFSPEYFDRLLEAFDAEPELGIASGVCLERASGGDWQPRFATGESAWGAARAYRRGCLAAVLPLEDKIGWDGIDSLKASLSGWRTRTLPELTFRHHRREGERDGSRRRAWSAQGRAAHYMDYRWSYLLARAMYRARSEPAALAMISGFLGAALRREPRYPDERVRAELRSRQRLTRLPQRAREARGVMHA